MMTQRKITGRQATAGGIRNESVGASFKESSLGSLPKKLPTKPKKPKNERSRSKILAAPTLKILSIQ